MRVTLDLDEVVFGVHRDLEVDTAVLCETCEGSCCQPGTSPVTCDICHGTGQVQRQVRSLLGNVVTSQPCNVCQGYGTTIPYPCATCQGQGRVRARRTVSLDIPAGVETGLRLQLPGFGRGRPRRRPQRRPLHRGDRQPAHVFSRDGDDLLATLDVSMPDAVLGTTTTIQSLDGEVELEIRPGVQAGDVLTIKGRGITPLRGSQRGDLQGRRPRRDSDAPGRQGARPHRGLRQAHEGARAASWRSSIRGSSPSCATDSGTDDGCRCTSCSTDRSTPPQVTR